MKKTKVIIPALGILLLSTAASVTGTVAWFTTNNSVTASTMTVKAVVTGNLFIKEGKTAALDEINAVSASLSSSATALAPVDVIADGTVGAKMQLPKTYSTDPTVGGAGTVATYDTAFGSITPTSASGNAGYVLADFVSIANKQTVASTFFINPTVKVQVNNDDLLAKALRAGIVIAQEDDGVLGSAAYYESGDAAVAVDATDSKTYATLTFNGTTSYPKNLNDNKVYRLALMLWFEGDDTDCFVNNAQHLGNCVANWTFKSIA